jgi:hypothetical protein
MATLAHLAKKTKEFSVSPLPQAHFLERHLFHPSSSWEDGCRALRDIFPKDTRAERAKSWYRVLVPTHGPGRVIPGNGPFYVPEWALPGEDCSEMIKALKAAGFKEAVAHVVYLPSDSEYLAAAMRAALKDHEPQRNPSFHAWNANPLTYRAYIYPQLHSLARKPLRAFNVERFRR